MGDTLRRGMEDAGGRFGMGGASIMQKYMNYNPSGQVQTQVMFSRDNRQIESLQAFDVLLNYAKFVFVITRNFK